MGFFFADQKKALEKKVDPLYHKKFQHEYGCSVCPLRKLVKPMLPDGDAKADLYVLSLYPLKDDLLGMMENYFPKSIKVRYGSLIRCRTKVKYSDAIINCCSAKLEDDIEESDPIVILSLGYQSLKWLCGQSDVPAWRGRKLPVLVKKTSYWVIPTYDFNFLAEKSKTAKVDINEFDRVFDNDVYDAVDLVEDCLTKEIAFPNVITKNYTKNIEIVLGNHKGDFGFLHRELDDLKKEKNVGIDIETHGLRPFFPESKWLTIAIGVQDYTLAFPIEFPGCWNEHKILSVKELVKDFILHCKKPTAHFLKMELEWFLYYFGAEVVWDVNWQDTAALEYTLDERSKRMLSLDNVCYQVFGFYLKALSNLDRKNLINEKIEDVLLYNGLDSKWTSACYRELIKKLPKAQRYTYECNVDNTKSLAFSMNHGIMLNRSRWKKLDIKYSKRIAELETEINSLPEIKQAIKKFGFFDMKSPNQLVVVLRDILKLKQVKKTKKEGFSTDVEALDLYAAQGVELALLIKEHRQVSTRYSKYFKDLDQVIDEKGYIHPEFNTLVTSTGRLSSGRKDVSYGL